MQKDIKQILSGGGGGEGLTIIIILQAQHKTLEKLAQLFQFSIHVHPCHPRQQKTENKLNT